MKIRKAIEQLAKQNWDAELLIDIKENRCLANMCSTKDTKKIKSISSFTKKGKPIVTLNIND